MSAGEIQEKFASGSNRGQVLNVESSPLPCFDSLADLRIMYLRIIGNFP